jgi:hypothetical protein
MSQGQPGKTVDPGGIKKPPPPKGNPLMRTTTMMGMAKKKRGRKDLTKSWNRLIAFYWSDANSQHFWVSELKVNY